MFGNPVTGVRIRAENGDVFEFQQGDVAITPIEQPPLELTDEVAPAQTGEILTDRQFAFLQDRADLGARLGEAMRAFRENGDDSVFQRMLEDAKGDIDIAVIREGLRRVGVNPDRVAATRMTPEQELAALEELTTAIEGTDQQPPVAPVAPPDADEGGRAALAAPAEPAPRPPSGAVAGAAPADLNAVDISFEVEVDETGGTVTVTENAGKALAEASSRVALLQELAECLR